MLITLTPFIPCSARLPIISLIAGFFFDKYMGLVTASFYFLAIAVIILSAIILKKTIYKDVNSSYVCELPEFRLPDARYVARDVWEKTWGFIKRAGTVIFLCSVVIWVLLSFSWRFEYGIPVEKSILASIGNLFSWIFYPMLGELSWGATVSAIQGLVAKEQVVSSMAVIAGFSGEVSGNLLFSGEGIFGFLHRRALMPLWLSTSSARPVSEPSAPCIKNSEALRKHSRQSFSRPGWPGFSPLSFT